MAQELGLDQDARLAVRARVSRGDSGESVRAYIRDQLTNEYKSRENEELALWMRGKGYTESARFLEAYLAGRRP